MHLSSDAFEDMQFLPKKYGKLYSNVNPPLTIKNLPLKTKSLVLIVDDPDAPSGLFVHWVVYNIPLIFEIEENSIPGVQGKNDYNIVNFGGPNPPFGTHRYFFKMYALDTILTLPPGASASDVQKAMKGHILDQAQIIGLYKKE